MLHVVTIEVSEEFFEPLIHDLVVGPAVFELVQENRPPLPGLVIEGREDGILKILLDGFAVTLVQIAGPVVGRSLGAHIVACSELNRKILKRAESREFRPKARQIEYHVDQSGRHDTHV